MTLSNTSKILKIITALWIIWGLVHMLAGIIIISSDTPAAFAAVADAVDPTILSGPYHEAAGALINQHGFNLLWIGLVTVIGAVLIWRGNIIALFVTGLVGGLTDVGYFIFMDLGGHVNFMPGTLMTVVSATAIILSLIVWNKQRNTTSTT